MTIAYFTNVLNHHQVALCDEIYRQNDGNFYFIETGKLEAERQAMGYQQYDRKYVIRLSSEENRSKAEQLAVDADIAIMGAESFDFLKLRLTNSSGITFSYSERWLKRGFINILSPTFLKQIKLYITKGHKRKWYMLAASGYLANDLARVGIFRNKVFKWGYFPKYPEVASKQTDDTGRLKILWVARFIDWKRPDIMIKLAEKLQLNNYNFEITMIGDGEMMPQIKSQIQSNPSISDKIVLKGNIAPDDVLKEMANNDVYCFTSTRKEGWGAVLGEAMASGCCPVASADAGATPFLIKNGENGLIFRTDNLDELYQKVVYLIDNPHERHKMSDAAKGTMASVWNAASAANNLLKLSTDLLNNRPISITEGPCSRAKK